MTQPDTRPTTPATEAGRRLLTEHAPSVDDTSPEAGDRWADWNDLKAVILAIEAEAASPAALDVERLAKALALVHETSHSIHDAVEHWESYRADANEIIAAYGAVHVHGDSRMTDESEFDRGYRIGNRDGYEAGMAEAASPAALDVDWDRMAEAWGNVMDGRRIGQGINAPRIGARTTTDEDWEAIAAEYARLTAEQEDDR